jgi:hypothetical protein
MLFLSIVHWIKYCDNLIPIEGYFIQLLLCLRHNNHVYDIGHILIVHWIKYCDNLIPIEGYFIQLLLCLQHNNHVYDIGHIYFNNIMFVHK